MDCVVFSGPTLAPTEAASLLAGATCLGPAACGDVLRAERAGARVLVLIDGYFEHTRSVWHKELLWALHQGVRIYGAASLGALRAVELQPFGMIGVGRVFEAFRDGVLQDDDEVTIVHESAERGYRPKSDALVNIRATLSKAVDEGVVARGEADRVLSEQKECFYPFRDLRAVVQRLPSLAPWLATGAVDQKRLDALAVLEQVQRDLAAGEGARRAEPPSFEFAYTEAWHVLRERMLRGPA